MRRRMCEMGEEGFKIIHGSSPIYGRDSYAGS